MKRILSIMLIFSLLLPAIALADTVRQQVSVPEHVTGEWYSNTGLTHIIVDAQVIVPDVNSISVYAVEGRDVIVTDVMAMAMAAAPGTNWNKDWLRLLPEEWTLQASWHDEPYIITNEENIMINYIYTWPSHVEAGSYNWHIHTLFGEKRIFAETSYRYTDNSSFTIHLYNTVPLAIVDTETLPGQTLSLSQARALAERMAASVQPGFVVEREGISYLTEKDGEINQHKEAYWFGFTRRIDGISVTMTSNSSLGNIEDENSQGYESYPKVEMLVCVVDQDRIVYASFTNPWNIGEALQENVQLLPFEQIMKVFGTIAPLSIQSQEGDKNAQHWTYGNAMQINEVRLGYMPVLAKDGDGDWELRPVWDFFGIHTSGATIRDEAGLALLTIDAIDGTIIDRNYGY